MNRLAMRVRRLFAVLAAASVLALPLAGPAAAAGVTFGTPSATASYLHSIEFSVTYAADGPIRAAELRLLNPGAMGPWITPLETPSLTSGTLRYTLDTTGAGHIAPNTVIRATFAITTPSGTSISDTVSVRYRDTSQDWQSVKGSLVTVYWYTGSQSFGQQALQIAEKAVRDTANLLGVTESEPIDFYIYGDSGAFRDALGPSTRENVGGQAHADIRTMFALITPAEIGADWVGSVVPHELTHLVFDTAVTNPYRFPPRWLNEGLATYLSDGYSAYWKGFVRNGIRSGDLLPLVALTGQFPTDGDKTYLAYGESVSAVDYLVRTSGRPALINLVKAYKAGLTDDEAFDQALGTDVAGFQAGWLKAIGAATPQQYGPQPAPPGPVPPGWDQTPPDGSGGSPDPSGAAASPGSATPAPTARPVDGPADQGADTDLILIAVIAVAGVMLGVLLLAGRKARAQ